MFRPTSSLALAAVLIACPAAAAVVSDCGDAANPANIVEPWEANSRTFAKGDIRIAYLDTGGEPACCSGWLMVLYDEHPKDEPEYRACKLVGQSQGLGFEGVDFKAIKASYDPRRGLLLSVPVT